MFNIIKLNEKDNIGIAPMDIPQNININYGIKSINNFKHLSNNKFIPFGFIFLGLASISEMIDHTLSLIHI